MSAALHMENKRFLCHHQKTELASSKQISTHLLIEGFLPVGGFCFAWKASKIKGFRVCATFSGFIGAGAKGASMGKRPKSGQRFYGRGVLQKITVRTLSFGALWNNLGCVS
jgi:hypothetical protein